MTIQSGRLDLSQRDPVEIQLYTVEEVGRVMAAAEKYAPGLVPFLAVSFFCGVRRAEALRLDWSAIDLHENFVKLPAAITKTKQGRHIEISENCRAWLTPYVKGEPGEYFLSRRMFCATGWRICGRNTRFPRSNTDRGIHSLAIGWP